MQRISTRWTQDHALPTPPLEVAEAVELWARKYGRHATLVYVPPMKCWSVNLSLKPGDPALKRWQEGKADREPTEGVLLIEWDPTLGDLNPATGEKAGGYRAVDLEEYGPSGVVDLLEKGDTWSGRGEFASMQEAVVGAASRWRNQKEATKAKLRSEAGYHAKHERRLYTGNPLVSVPANLNETRTDAGD